MKYRSIASTIYNRPQAIEQWKLEEIAALIEMRERGDSLSQAEIRAVIPEDRDEIRPYGITAAGDHVPMEAMNGHGHGGLIAVMPLFGTIFQHAGMLESFSGGTSTETFGDQFDAFVANPEVSTIVIKTHSPGGSIYGVEELSSQIHAARKSGTRIIAVADSMTASAATWIATAAHEVVVTPGGEIGSIGVISMYADQSEREEATGIRRTIVRTPEMKARFTGVEPMDDDMLRTMVKRNEEAYDTFVRAMARNRGVSQTKVRDDFGGGEMQSASESTTSKLSDQTATFRDVMTELRAGIGAKSRRARQAQANRNRLALAAASLDD